MAYTTWDTIIVGAGLAGTTLAWRLKDLGDRVLVLDDGARTSSSRIAAGLLTPITGQRLGLSQQIAELLPAAEAYYRDVEARTGAHFYHARTAIRLFVSEKERALWQTRAILPEYRAHLQQPQPDPLIDPALADAPEGGFAMRAAQLDVRAYLDASRTVLSVQPIALDWHSDVVFADNHVTVAGETARRVISCEGYAASKNPFLTTLAFRAAKGDILTVRFERPLPPQSIHRGIWIAPAAGQAEFRVGATYDLETLDNVPTERARHEIESNLNGFIRVPYTVVGHHAAVRPIVRRSHPVAGFHPALPRLGYFNGLGSKGSLLSPWYAARFAADIVGGAARANCG